MIRQHAHALDWNAAVEQFIARYENTHTARTYTDAIAVFRRWTAEQGMLPAILTRVQAESYAARCIETMKLSSARLHIAVVGNLYRYLARNDHIATSPFIRHTRPITPPVPPRVPTAAEIERVGTQADIERVIKRAPEHVGVVIRIIAATGLRAGALVTMQIEDDGSYIARGKENLLAITGRIPVELVAAARNAIAHITRPIDGYIRTHRQIIAALGTALASAFRRAGVRQSIHDVRDLYALRLYISTDYSLEAVQRALQHKAVTSTVTYLQRIATDIYRRLAGHPQQPPT